MVKEGFWDDFSDRMEIYSNSWLQKIIGDGQRRYEEINFISSDKVKTVICDLMKPCC